MAKRNHNFNMLITKMAQARHEQDPLGKECVIRKLINIKSKPQKSFSTTPSMLLSAVDFFTTSALVASTTYGFCSSTYLTPFVISNAVHLGASCILSYAKTRKLLNPEHASFISVIFGSCTVWFSLLGFSENISSAIPNLYTSAYIFLANTLDISNMQVLSPLIKQISVIDKDWVANSFVLGVITTSCFGLINKITSIANPPSIAERSSKRQLFQKVLNKLDKESYEYSFYNSKLLHSDESYGSSILISCFNDFLGNLSKYFIHCHIGNSNIIFAPLAGFSHYGIRSLLNSNFRIEDTWHLTKTTILKGLVGAYNYTVYHLLDYNAQLPTKIGASVAIEYCDAIAQQKADEFLVSSSFESKLMRA